MNQSEIDKIVSGLMAELQPAGAGEREVVTRQGPSERLRAMAQGATFGGADEAEAWLRSQFGGEDYTAALEDIRGKLSDYRNARPGEAFFNEVGGATLPTIIASVMSGGGATASQFPRLAQAAKIIGIGGAEGGAYAFNTGEGGFENRRDRVPGGIAYGAAGAAVGGAAMAGAGAALRKMTDLARRKLGPRAATSVERAIRKAAEDSGKTVDEIIDDVANGRILAENKTIATVARAWRAQSSEADDVLRRGISGRPDVKRGELMDYLQESMGAEGNALQKFTMDDEAARAAAGADYKRIFAANPGPVSDDMTSALIDAYRRVPAAKQELDKLLRAQTGRTPFFRETDQGIEFLRAPNLEEAEIMRRSISTAAGREFSSGGGAVGQAYGDIEKGVRSQIDATSPALAGVRKEWSGIERAREAFEAGRKSLSNPDQAAMDFAKYSQDENVLKAYRAGVTHAMRQKANTGARKSLPRNLASEDTREGQILRMAAPEDNLDEILRRATNATDAQDTVNEVLGGSQTAITEGRMAEQGLSAAESVMDAAGGSPGALLRLAGQAVKAMKPGLTPKQAADAARLVVETDPQIVARALTDRTALDALYNLVDRTTRTGTRAGVTSGGAIGGLLGSIGQ